MSGPTTTTNFLFTGATGYIGGSVLARFLAHPHAASNKFHFTVLVRDPTKAEKFRALGGGNVTVVVGSHSDVQLVERLASETDVVIATADADDLGAAKATLTGLRKRHAQSGVAPIFINTSGTGVLSDQAKGMYAGTTVYDDSDADQIEGIAPTASHRDVDLAITAADAEGYIKSYIILPSTIYGLATGLLVDAGLQNPHSIQVPSLISAALDRGRAGMVGEGKNLWPNVEIHELADLYTTLYDRIVADASTGHGRNGFYFGASREHSLYEVGRAVGAVLVALRKSEIADPTPFTQAELDKYFGGSPDLGSNSRCRATRSLSLGWNPVKTTKDLLATIQSEAEAIIENKAESAVLKAWTRGR